MKLVTIGAAGVLLGTGASALPTEKRFVAQNEASCAVSGSGPYQYKLDIGIAWDAGDRCNPAEQSLASSIGAIGFTCAPDGIGYTDFQFQVAFSGSDVNSALGETFPAITFRCPS